MGRCLAFLVSAVALAACTERPEVPALAITSIEPSEVDQGQAVAVAIQGSGFHAIIESDLDNGTAYAVGLSVNVGPVVLEAMQLQSETRIDGTVPSSLAVGLHDVVVSIGDQTATLPAAFRVIQRCADSSECDDGDPCTTVETCDGSGRCVNAGPDLDTDGDGFVDGACGGDDCDDDDEFEHPGAVWYPDADGDGDGDVRSPGTACERAADDDVGNANDCDDGDPNVHHGTSCDDGDSCTELDTCTLGACGGVDTCSAQCEQSCDSGCGPDNCCIETCNGNCPTCNSSCSCDQTCTAVDCSTTCSSDASCRLTANSDQASLSCAARATCTLVCTGGSSCSMSCASDAVCLVDCGGAAQCDLSCSSGTPTNCGGGILVCHRSCP